MEQKPNTKCSICGKEYYRCMSSMNMKSFTPWKAITDSIDCYKIYLTLQAYHNGHANRSKTQLDLRKCNLSELHSFPSELKNTILEILDESLL